MDYQLLKIPSDTQIAWFAGFFDGEGCIHISNKKANPNCLRKSFLLEISVNSTHIPTIHKVKEMWNFGNVYIFQPKASNGRQRKPAARWMTVSTKAANVLRLCLPYLSIKRDEAEVAIAFQETKRRNIIVFGHGSQPTNILNQGERFRKLLVSMPTRKLIQVSEGFPTN